MATANDEHGVQLEPMEQLAEALGKEDDWTGLTDAKARRKRQNRLNQRAYRRRKTTGTHSKASETPLGGQFEIADNSFTQPPQLQPSNAAGVQPRQLALRCPLQLSSSDPVLRYFSTDNAGTTEPSIIFPFSADHLLTLIQFNAFRAILANFSLLTLLVTVPSTCSGALQVSTVPPPGALPPSLVPTPIQQTVPHALWIDLFPLGTLRDNLIEMADKYDEDELCADLVGSLFEDYEYESSGRWGFIAWSNPWDVKGWEATEGFVKKWGFLLKGCPEVIEESNRWRAIRDEDPLVVEV